MASTTNTNSQWGASYRLIAAEKWKAKSAAMGREVTRQLVAFADPKPGMKVLDLASGTGEPAISLASQVGPTGQVTAFDLSADLLEIAAKRAADRSLSNFSIQQGDAHALPFADQSFDLATCRFGVMFFADLGRALGELCRVLKPGGRACFVAWGPFEQPYWENTMGLVHRRVGGALLDPGSAGMFRFAVPGTLSEALRAAGFSAATEELRAVDWNWPGPAEEVWEYARSVSTPFRPLLERVPQEEWPQLNAEVKNALAPMVDGDTVKFKVLVVVGAGTR